MPKNVELPSEVAKECFLFEAINYLVCGCPPVESFDHDSYDFRSCEYLYCGEYDTGLKENILLTAELISEQYNIEMNPQYDIKYQEIVFHDIEAYDKQYTNKIDTFPESHRQDILDERQVVVEYIEKQNQYNEKIEKITLPWHSKLLQELRSGNIVGNGFLVQKYSETENEFVDI